MPNQHPQTAQNFRPGPAFSLATFSWSDQPVAETIVGPSAALIGWIPAFPEADLVPVGRLRNLYEDELSIRQLLRVGNAAPPERFPKLVAAFQTHLSLGDYRGALCLDQPTLHLDAQRRPVGVEFLSLAKVGNTPIRIPASDPWLQLNSSGATAASGDLLVTEDFVTIRLFMRLKLSFIGRGIARVMTGTWPPWATLSIEYEIPTLAGSPSAEIHFAGTAVPSRTAYIDWKTSFVYEMEQDLSEAAYRGFLNAGGCHDAMAIRRRIEGTLRRTHFPSC